MTVNGGILRILHWMGQSRTGQTLVSLLLIAAGAALGVLVDRRVTAAPSAEPALPAIEMFSPALGNTDAVLSLQTPIGTNGVHHLCTATLIKPTWVVTAAHCVTPPPRQQQHSHAAQHCAGPQPAGSAIDIATATLTVRGRSKTYLAGGETATVTEKHVMPGWNWGKHQPGARDADLALLKLDHPLSITPIPLTTVAPPANTWTLVYGWGTRSDRCGEVPPDLQQWALKTQPCPQDMTRWEYCTTTNKAAGPCDGASGGPLLTLTNGTTPTIIGVYSRTWGTYCGQHPLAFTSLTEYQDFITQVTTP